MIQCYSLNRTGLNKMQLYKNLMAFSFAVIILALITISAMTYTEFREKQDYKNYTKNLSSLEGMELLIDAIARNQR